MAVRKEGKSWWIDFRFNGTRHRKRSPENSMAGAKAYEALLRRKLLKGESIDNRKEEQDLTFYDFGQKWLKTYVKTNNRPSEQQQKEMVLRVHLNPFFGDKKLSEITSLKVEEFKEAKNNGQWNVKTINNHLAILGKLLNTAEEWEIIKHAPKIKKIKAPPTAYNYLTSEESNNLLNSIDDELWHDMIFTALHTGMRFGELCALNWKNVDLKNRKVIVKESLVRDTWLLPPKSNKNREIPLTDDICSILAKRKKKKGIVFSKDSITYLKHERCRRTLIRYCKQARIKKTGWHDLRHTFATNLANRGVAVQIIQKLLGHADIATTMRYAHVMDQSLRDAVDVLNEGNKNFGQNMVKISKIHA